MKRVLVVVLILLPIVITQQACLESCSSGNGGGYSGLKCGPDMLNSPGMTKRYYHFSETDNCTSEFEPTHSGVLNYNYEIITYRKSSCASATQVLNDKEVQTFSDFLEIAIYDNQIFAIDGYLNKKENTAYPKLFCRTHGVNYLVVKRNNQLVLVTRGTNTNEETADVSVNQSLNADEIEVFNQSLIFTAKKSDCVID